MIAATKNNIIHMSWENGFKKADQDIALSSIALMKISGFDSPMAGSKSSAWPLSGVWVALKNKRIWK